MSAFYYKCRQCGEVFTDSGIGDSHAIKALFNSIYEVNRDKPNFPLKSLHACNKDSVTIGVSDLIGFKPEKPSAFLT